MTTHEELVAEMTSLERLSVQDRLKLARKRRAAQMKRWTANDKEFIKKSRKSAVGKIGHENSQKRRIQFAHNIQLLEAAARGDIDEVRSLLESGVNPNIGNEDGLTALHQCCIDNNDAMMKLLVEHGADVNVTDRELWTPLHASSTCGHVNLARFLVEKGAHLLTINSDGNMPYDICEDENTLDYIESQMADKGITQEHIDELRDVAPNHMLEDLIELKENNGDLEQRDEIGATFLHIAAANGYDKVAKFLLDNNVDVNAKDIDGWQPIHAAACWAHGEMIQLLVQYGADLDATTNNDETPLTICEDEDLKNLINQLKAEMHAHRSLDKLVRRNSSRNKRSSSIRRSSKREKGEMRKLDAKGEAMFIQSQVSTDELPATNIDEVKIDTEEPQDPTLVNVPSENNMDLEGEHEDEINGALETDIIPLPSITEESPDSPERKARLKNSENNESFMQNGENDTGLGVTGLKRQPKSILKKRKEQEEMEDTQVKKSRRDKEADSRKQQLEMEKQREKEEREKAKQREKEERQKEKEEREREKQRLKEEKRQHKREKEEKEREKNQKRKTISDENVVPKENNQSKEQGDNDKNHSGSMETLAQLKRHRASEHTKRTLSGDSNEEFESAWSESGRKDSFDILKDHQSQNSTKQKKSPHIARKLIPHRPASGSYSFTETSLSEGHRDSNASEQNGVGELNSPDPSHTSINDSFPGDPPLKRFTAAVPEVIGGDDDRRCCIIL